LRLGKQQKHAHQKPQRQPKQVQIMHGSEASEELNGEQVGIVS
jgi:hypothetical protein